MKVTEGAWCLNSLALRLIGFLPLAFMLGGCSGIKHVEWTEDVQLSDGRMYVAQRTEDYRHIVDAGAGFQSGWLFYKASITAELPPPVGRKVAWEGNLLPVVLDIQPDGHAYLVGYVATGAAADYWRLPDHEFYIIFRLMGDQWVRIPLDQLPALVRPNLLSSGSTLFIDTQSPPAPWTHVHVDLKQKAELDKDLRPNHPMRVIVRLPAPTSNKPTR